jgi:predicted ATPase/DNA-binding SARP family transcriptional activator
MAHLSLSVFGSVQVALDGQMVPSFKYNSARALLIYLAVEASRSHRRETLATLFWPELPEQAARTNLRQSLANLRAAVGDHTANPPFLQITRETIQFNLASDYDLDITAFGVLLDACAIHEHARRERCAACAQRLSQAVKLYQGDFLEHFDLPASVDFEEWALRKREELHQRALHACADLTDYHEQSGAYDQASWFARRQIELEPWREEAHRQLMRVLFLDGERSAALAQYERCRQILAEELQVEPEQATYDLYKRIHAADPELAAARVRPAGSPARRYSLPPSPTPLIGREAELAELRGLLADSACRLVTLVGPGGIGKTRLALQAASTQIDAFPDRVCFVGLTSLPSAELLVSTIAEALEVRLDQREDPKDQLFTYLRDRQLLLVLDNFEHLLDGAGLLAELLESAPHVKLLVTSREVLRLQWEQVFDVPGLEIPAVDQVDGIEDSNAVALFLQRARSQQRSFHPQGAERVAVVAVCRALEGMPLGIELAATWVRVLSCQDIAQEIQRDGAVLSTTLRDLPARHRSLEAVFDHSYQLLIEDERRVFRAMAIFQGGCDRAAAVRVAGASLPLLQALVDKSLLRRSVADRYDMHERIRQYAEKQLCAAGELAEARSRHLTYFLELAEAVEPKLQSHEQLIYLDQLDSEHDNLRAALAWGLAGGDTSLSVRLAGALGWFWFIHNHPTEGSGWLQRALERSQDDASSARAKALYAAAIIAISTGDSAHGAMWSEEAVALYRGLGDIRMYGYALGPLGVFTWEKGDIERNIALWEESLAVARAVGDRWLETTLLYHLGLVQPDGRKATALWQEALTIGYALGDRWSISSALALLVQSALDQGDIDHAAALAMENLAISREMGDKRLMSSTLNALGDVARMDEDYERAAGWYQQSLLVAHDAGTHFVADSCLNLGYVALYQGDVTQAATLFAEVVARYQHPKESVGIALGVAGCAGVASKRGQAERAAYLLGAATALLKARGTARDMVSVVNAAEHERIASITRAQLSEEAFAVAWTNGAQMMLEQAIAEALNEPRFGTASMEIAQ